MSDPRDRVDRLLYDGERVVESVALGGDRVVVTSHRLLALTPETDGANFRAVDLPNVEGVRVSTDGTRRYLRWTVRPLVLGLLLLLGGSLIDLDDPLAGTDTSGAGATGAGGIVSTVSSFTSLLAVLDEALLAGGAVCLLVVALLLGLYLRSRATSLVVSVAGDDDVRIPAAAGREETATRLEAAIASAGDDDPGTTATFGVDDGGVGPGDEPVESDDATDPEGGDDGGVDEPRTVEDLLGDAPDAGGGPASVPPDPPPSDDEPK